VTLHTPGEHTLAAALTTEAATVDPVFLVFGVVVALLIALFIVGARKSAQQERRRQEELWAYATRCGWIPVQVGVPLPGPVTEAAASRRSKLVLGTRLEGFELWLVWHRWTETTSSGETTTSSTRNLTRYFLYPGRPCPDVRLSRRTAIGGSLIPTRGVGTGDAEFDRRFLIRSDAGPLAQALLTPDLRHAMLTGALPVWEIKGGVLVTAYNDRPQIENLQHRAGAAVHIAKLLG
jgi:hypothetical protein